MFYGLVLSGPSPYPDGPRVLMTPVLHNLTNEEMKISAQAMRDRLAQDGRTDTKVSMFTHAFQHDGGVTETAADCEACYAAVVEKLEILREEENARAGNSPHESKGHEEGSNQTQTQRKDS